MIKVGILISYDYIYLKQALPCIYEDSDKIVLAVDKDNQTWSGNTIHIPQEFYDWINEYDKDNKIEIYKDRFYNADKTAMENELLERNKLAQFMGNGGWHIQIDSDEYFNNFKDFVNFLKNLDPKYLQFPEKYPIEISVFWVTLYKKVDGGFLYFKNFLEAIEIVTNCPNYKHGRNNNHKKKIITKYFMFHQSWAREDAEILTKISNWGHKDDPSNQKYYLQWKNINIDNYKEYSSFQLFNPFKRKVLEFVSNANLSNFNLPISNFDIKIIKLKNYIVNIISLFINEKLRDKLRNILIEFQQKN